MANEQETIKGNNPGTVITDEYAATAGARRVIEAETQLLIVVAPTASPKALEALRKAKLLPGKRYLMLGRDYNALMKNPLIAGLLMDTTPATRGIELSVRQALQEWRSDTDGPTT
jgi:hypothetical protein